MLKIKQLNQYYAQSHTLWDLDIDIPAGSCFSLMGRNGVGKTTLLQCIMGLLPVHSGSIELEGNNLCGKPAFTRAGQGVGYVPQGRMIFPLLTVEENLRVGLAARHDNSKVIPEQIYELFPVLKTMLRRRGGDLSGGQQQQLAIGRALVIEPKMLVLDEPTEGIQPNIVHEIGDIVTRLNSELGLTVLLVEQKLPFVQRICDRFCIMDKGRAVAGGEIAELDKDLVKRYLTV
jgi:urea transport system ATP-binding protein